MTHKEELLSMDGEVLSYDSVTATQNIGGIKFNEDYLTDYFNADGEDGDDFYDGKLENYENAIGKKFRQQQKKRQRRRDLRTKSKAKARETRARARETSAKAKIQQAKAQQLSAKASEKSVASDVALAEALKVSAPTTPIEEKKGLSMGAKIGIGVGIAVVLGVAGFFIWKATKGAKGK